MTRKRLGCSWVPDFIFKDACAQHDKDYDKIRYYKEGKMPRKYLYIQRYMADIDYYEYMLLLISLHGKHERFYKGVAYLYWVGVRLFGGFTI